MTSPAALDVPDEPHEPDMPMSMTASVVLTHLPRDASQALKDVDALDDRKGTNSQHKLCLSGKPSTKSLFYDMIHYSTSREFISSCQH